MLPALLGLGYERDGALAGFALQHAVGRRPGGRRRGRRGRRGAAARRSSLEPQPLTITVPDDNEAGARLLADWGFQPVNTALRMRHGPPVGHDPSRMFGLFNLFWG